MKISKNDNSEKWYHFDVIIFRCCQFSFRMEKGGTVRELLKKRELLGQRLSFINM